MMTEIVKGNIINPVNENKAEILKEHFIVVENGIILAVLSENEFKDKYQSMKYTDHSNDIIVPGFIDTHTHVPQYPAIGKGKGELLDWLESYIFPLEHKFADRNYAFKTASKFFESCLKFGTTTVSAYSSVHYESTRAVFEAAEQAGVRAFIGNSLMDNSNFSELYLNADDNINAAYKLTKEWHEKNELLNYVVTPRYAGSCSFELLQKAASFAKKHDLLIQTHLAENLNEIELIKNIFPGFETYADVYYKSGILSEKTILAHCIHLTEHEKYLLNDTGSKIAHCPTSNAFLLSGIMPFREYREMGLDIGLGSDVSAGYSLDLKNEAKNAIEYSKLYRTLIDKKKIEMQAKEAFYLMTLGGAKVLKIENVTGSVEAGKKADFAIFANEFENGKPEDFCDIDEVLGKLIYSGRKEALKTIVSGKTVYREP